MNRKIPMKPILDVCCGGKMFYFDKNNPNVLFCDKRKIDTTLCDGRRFVVDPDVVCDFTNLPFDNNTFKAVIFDPPHLTRNTGDSKYAVMYGSLSTAEPRDATGYQHIKYGDLPQQGWETMISRGFSECFRVLRPGGVLIFKWSEVDIPVSKILGLTPEQPILGHRSGKRSATHWILFMKEAEDDE